MLEAVVAVIGIVIFGTMTVFYLMWIVAAFLQHRDSSTVRRRGVGIFIISATASAYFVVRFDRWAWATSIPAAGPYAWVVRVLADLWGFVTKTAS